MHYLSKNYQCTFHNSYIMLNIVTQVLCFYWAALQNSLIKRGKTTTSPFGIFEMLNPWKLAIKFKTNPKWNRLIWKLKGKGFITHHNILSLVSISIFFAQWVNSAIEPVLRIYIFMLIDVCLCAMLLLFIYFKKCVV